MQTIVIKADIRDTFGKKLSANRKAGQVPGVVYGNQKENQSVFIDAHDFGRIFQEVGYSTIVELKVDGGEKENVLIHDVDINPLSGNIQHVDFYRINMNKAIRTEVPLHFVGEAPAVFQQEGSLFKNIEEVEVETLPANLPPHIEVDISGLDDFTKTLHVSDLKVGEGVEILTDMEQLVCKVEPPRSEEELAALEEEVGDATPEGAEEEGAEGEEKTGEESAEAPAEENKE